MKKGTILASVTLALTSVLFIALRFWRMTDSCLWFDEIFSVHAASMDFQALLRFVAQDLIHPPLSYLLLKIWILAGGETLYWLRLFPVFFSILSLVPLIFLCRALKLNFATTAVAIFWLAANGCLIKYSQEVRMYAPFLFFALMSLWFFARFLNWGKNIWILTFVNILLVYTHYFGWLLVVSEIVAILVLQRIKIRQMLVMLGLTLAAFAPWIFAVWKAAGEIDPNLGQNIGWIAKPYPVTLVQFLLDLIEPFYYQQSSDELASFYYIAVPVLLLVVTAFVLYLIDWKSFAPEEKQNIILFTILMKLPILLVFLASWILPYSIWGTRHLIFVYPMLAILAAIALTRVKPAPVAGVFLGLIFLLFGAAFLLEAKRGTPRYIWCAWENLAASLDRRQAAKIYVFEDVIAYDMWFALRDAGSDFEIIKVNGIEDIPEDKAYFLPRGFDKVRTTDENGIEGERFFVAYRAYLFTEKEAPLRSLVNKGYKIGEPKIFDTNPQATVFNPSLKGFLVEVRK